MYFLFLNRVTNICRLIIDLYSLLSGSGKLQERIVFKHIYNHLIDNNLLYKYQLGFLPTHSTTFQLCSSNNRNNEEIEI